MQKGHISLFRPIFSFCRMIKLLADGLVLNSVVLFLLICASFPRNKVSKKLWRSFVERETKQ